jgi:hypothetical protein
MTDVDRARLRALGGLSMATKRYAGPLPPLRPPPPLPSPPRPLPPSSPPPLLPSR